MAKKPDVSDAQVHKKFTEFLAGELPPRGLKRALSRFRGEGVRGKRMAKKWYGKFLDGGGKEGDWQSFFKFLLENLPAIIAMIMALFPK
jgi:hypothetical protein